MNSQLENKEKSAESMVGAYRAESTDQYTAGSRITAKIPNLCDGSTFEYEELFDDWLDLAVLEAEKGDPALKNRLVGDANMYKGQLNRESLRAADGVKYFRDTLRPHFTKGAQSVFFWRFYQFTRARRGNAEMVKWLGKISLSRASMTTKITSVCDGRPSFRHLCHLSFVVLF